MKEMIRETNSYPIQLLASDLQHEELIHQIADSLDQLKGVIDHVFSNVEAKVATNKDRLAKISDRAKLAQVKVDKLKGRKKATQVSIVSFQQYNQYTYNAEVNLKYYRTC